MPETDLFASFFSWTVDPFSKGRDAFQVSREHRKGNAFPSFSLISRVLKVLTDQATLILITPAWQTQLWYTQFQQMPIIKHPLLLQKILTLLTVPNGEIHPLVGKGNLELLAWTVSGKTFSAEGISENSASFITDTRTSGETLIVIRSHVSYIDGASKEKLIPLTAL